MNIPKLKHPKLCRILPYVIVLGSAALPIWLVFQFSLPDWVRLIVIFAALVGLLIYLFKNFMVLMMLDMGLAMLSCHQSARTVYSLPPRRSADAIRRSILRYGQPCAPTPVLPQPSALRYQFGYPLTVYSRGIERVVAAYEVDSLNKALYQDILRSAKANSKALTGRKKALFLDQTQKKQALHRVTVILILAHHVDPQMTSELYELLCKQCGDEYENCIVPCVVDLAAHTCVFNCLRLPYVGYQYPVKNRGIRLIKNRVFGGNLNLKANKHHLAPLKDMDPEYTLWYLWRELQYQVVGSQKEVKKCFESMSEQEIRVCDDLLYLKWDHRGICQAVELDTEEKLAKVEAVTTWAHPKAQPISKKLIREMESHILDYYDKQGYTVGFVNVEVVL